MSRLKARLECVGAKLTGQASLRHVAWREVLRCCLRYEGWKKRALARAMEIRDDGDLVAVTLHGRTIYWPSREGLERIVQFYLETFDAGNPHYFEAAGTVVGAGDVVLDIGGAEGYFALRVVERAARVFVFEPSETWRRCLARTFARALAEGRMVLAPVLAGRENGTVAFVEDENDPGLAHIQRPGERSPLARDVSMTTLDSFVTERGLDRVDYIKADVEGAEIDLIEGARATVARHRPKIAITTYHQPDHANRLVEMIRGIEPSYTYRVRGAVSFHGVPRPVIAHFWCEP